MAENLILMFFLVLPSMLFVGARKFFVTTRPTMKDQKTAAAMIGALWIVGLVAATGLFAGEVYYRFIYDQTDTLGLCKTSFRWFDRHFHTNPGNFRDTFTYQPAATPGVRRVSFIGDSYTAAQGIDELNDRFATQFAKQRPDQEVHVLAACGWDTSSQLEMAYHMATADQKYDADVVVLVYNLDDIADLVPDW